MGKKSTVCKNCGQPLSGKEKQCPACGERQKKPIYKRWWLWVIVVLIAIGVATGGEDGGDTAGDVTNTPVPTQSAASDAPEISDENENQQPQDDVPTEYISALKKAETYSAFMHMSKAAIYDQLVSEYGEQFSEEAATYAMEHLEADWNANALATAENYSETMHMSKAGIYDQLISEYGEQFTQEEAQYAVDNMQADWKANALEKAKSYQESMNMSPNAIYDQLISEYGEQFTPEEAQYAVDNLG